MKNKYVLGISCGYHDSAAALIKDGKVLSACEEERFTGIKHDSSFPTNSIKWMLKEKNLTGDDISVVCFYESPSDKLDRIKKTSKRTFIQKLNFFDNSVEKNRKQYKEVERQIYKHTNKDIRLVYGNHHLSHAAYGFYTSKFQDSAIVTVDGVGEWETTAIYFGNRHKIINLESINFPHSLGMLYSTFTAYLGFKPNEGEYKIMGLAPYGNPNIYEKEFKKLYKVDEKGLFKLNMKYFSYDYSETEMFTLDLPKLFQVPNRLPEEPLTQVHMDIAAGLQKLYEELFGKLLLLAYRLTKSKNIIIAGGCAYNGTANGKILQRSPFTKLHIPCAPSDAGSAIGAALHYYYTENQWTGHTDNSNPFLGPTYSKRQMKLALDSFDKDVYYEEVDEKKLIKQISKEITEGNVVGWFDGRIEFGARALGNRSILANPRDPQMKARVNRVIKKREGFRPFAPMVLKEYQTKYFKYKDDVPYMNQVVEVQDIYKKRLPAITHVDGSARIQTVYEDVTPRIANLLKQLQKDNRYPIVLNTSFNLKDQTMVLDPSTAVETFLDCEMDTLVLGNFIVKKKIL